MFPKLLGKCIHYHSLHAIYFLAMYSIEPEARIPLWHPKRMSWRQWINYLLWFKSRKAAWMAPTTPALSACRDSVPSYGSRHTFSYLLNQACARSTATDWQPSTGVVLQWPWQLMAWKGDAFLCVPVHSLLTVVFQPRIVMFPCISQPMTAKGIILRTANVLSIT